MIELLDALIVFLSSYYYCNRLSIELTGFQSGLISLVIAIAFYSILVNTKLGVVLKVLATAAWTFVLSVLLPIHAWTDGNKIWCVIIYVLIFYIVLCLHKLNIVNGVKNIPFIKKYIKKKEEEEFFSSRVGEKEMSCLWDRYDSLKSGFLQSYSIIEEKMKGVNLNSNSMLYKEIVLFINKGTEEYERVRYQINSCVTMKDYMQITIFVCKLEELNQKTIEYVERLSAIDYQNSKGEKVTEGTIGDEFFSGCFDRESLVKRYHQLMKMYHPDNQGGSEEMTIKIKTSYENLIKEYN